MRYEMIFGDDLFVECKNNKHMVAVYYKPMNGRYYPDVIRTYRDMADALNTEIPHMYADAVSMRRIIQEPKRWTVEDQKAGRLPEVGTEFQTSTGKRKCVITEGKFIFTVNDDAVEVYTIESAKPLETPEEKAARLRMEWSKDASTIYCRGSEHNFGKIYDALLSGALSVPTKGGE